MKHEKFTEFTERGIGLGREGGWGKEIKEKENLAWELYEQYPPTGGIILGHVLWDQRQSYLRPTIGTLDFAKSLVAESFQATQNLEAKDHWDYYHLGMCQCHGRGTTRDYSLAAVAFTESWKAGNEYAHFEALWARYLAGGSRLEAILDLTALRGKLADFAAYSARALTLLELGPPKVLASPSHIARLLLLRRALHDSCGHRDGARHINVAVEKELREGVNPLKELDSAYAFLALYLTARFSRNNPTGKEPLDWFRDAIDPNIPSLLLLCRRQEFCLEELQIIVVKAEAEGWRDSELAKIAAKELDIFGP